MSSKANALASPSIADADVSMTKTQSTGYRSTPFWPTSEMPTVAESGLAPAPTTLITVGLKDCSTCRDPSPHTAPEAHANRRKAKSTARGKPLAVLVVVLITDHLLH